MTLDELQAEFPIGSRWRHREDVGYYDRLQTAEGDFRDPFEVVGWHGQRVVFVDANNDMAAWEIPSQLRARIERIPDPTPCPITEPVTLRLWQRGDERPHWASWPGGSGTHLSRHGGVPPITLFPDGRYTWEGGPE